ncbi:DUF1479-domain-containing protein [Xylariaceae sp. FL1019]|nr:DUF1479-domain-containing protein [Xylariaceae sp. FL1019]
MEEEFLPSNISIDVFQSLVARYGALIESISADKPAKPEQRSLVQLDAFRYGEAVDAFGSAKPKRQMTHEDVKTLVEWKLRHGKFRPTLMKLVSSNESNTVEKTIHQVMTKYWSNQDIPQAVDGISKLKGIGPATASLLLSVHDPDRVIFFSDEAFWWLCSNGQKSPIKYNAKEYQQLIAAANEIIKRLGVGATDVEKVAYVLLRGDLGRSQSSATKSQGPASKDSGNPADKYSGTTTAKRKTTTAVDGSDGTVRRSDPAQAAKTLRTTTHVIGETILVRSRPRRLFPLAMAIENFRLNPLPSGNVSRKITSLSRAEPIALAPRFATMKRNMIACREKQVADSFYRLLRRLGKETEMIASCGSDIIPVIDYFDIQNNTKVSAFKKAVQTRGVAIIRQVIPPTVAQSWKEETSDYINDSPQMRGNLWPGSQRFDMYWSPGQVRARADSRLLDAQRFAMSIWQSSDESALVSSDHPVAYADRFHIRTEGDPSLAIGPHVDNGSVERWEPDGYGHAGTYQPIFDGRWEEYDPWDSTSRLRVTADLYNKASSCNIPPGDDSLLVCPMLHLTTAYILLRPFFTPRFKNPASTNFLHPTNWNMNVSQTSVLHGAVPGYTQELSTALHPHLDLNRTLVSIPALSPGDYVIWHPDIVHAIGPFIASAHAKLSTTVLYVPACPLTQTNALYLSRQRRAFLLGLAAPDFSQSGNHSSERDHLARPGVQDISDAGGEEGLRSMGLTPWDDRCVTAGNRRAEKKLELLRLANTILFPDRYDTFAKNGRQ